VLSNKYIVKKGFYKSIGLVLHCLHSIATSLFVRKALSVNFSVSFKEDARAIFGEKGVLKDTENCY